MNNPTPKRTFDLLSIARAAMIKAGFDIEPLAASILEIPSIPTTDLRDRLWSSIDDATTRDLDQVEYAELLQNGDIRLRIGIADVSIFVPKDSDIDRFAAHNCTSVYTGVHTFHMLPKELSTDLTSLVEGGDRRVVITEMIVSATGEVSAVNIFCALINNKAKLSYKEIGAWLDGRAGVPESVAAVNGMESQIKLQADAAMRLAEFRKRKGAIELETIQAVPVTSADGKIVELKVVAPNKARDLIANFMIAANVAMAQFLEEKGGPSLRRVVRSPEQWERIVEIAAKHGVRLPGTPDSIALAGFLARRKKADPVHFPDLSLAVVKALGPGEYEVQGPGEEGPGHFGLAADDYTHSTAPNRRFADLVTQRLVKAAISCAPTKDRPSSASPLLGGHSPYSVDELREIAARCTEREDASRAVERKMRKVAGALLLQEKIGREFDAIVTGVTSKGTFARVFKPPVDGRIVRGERRLRVGDNVRVRLISTNPDRGFIDFASVLSDKL